MMESLRTWAETHPDEKVCLPLLSIIPLIVFLYQTLVVSQWTQCLQLVSDYLTENGFLHVKYQGDMDRKKRDLAVRVFMAKDKAQVMLMSLKCGGVGLNLTRANRASFESDVSLIRGLRVLSL
jgi:SNF2 family DNA or RNA helicase